MTTPHKPAPNLLPGLPSQASSLAWFECYMCHRGQRQGRLSGCKRGGSVRLKCDNAEPGGPDASIRCEITCVKASKHHKRRFLSLHRSEELQKWRPGWALLSAVLWERHVVSEHKIQSSQGCCLPGHRPYMKACCLPCSWSTAIPGSSSTDVVCYPESFLCMSADFKTFKDFITCHVKRNVAVPNAHVGIKKWKVNFIINFTIYIFIYTNIYI